MAYKKTLSCGGWRLLQEGVLKIYFQRGWLTQKGWRDF